MEFLSNKPLLITDTILRDAHQSQAATRMTLEQMLPVSCAPTCRTPSCKCSSAARTF